MKNEFEGSPKTWPPLGLPRGSVRALLVLIVVAVVLSRIARDLPIDVLWIQAMLITVAHYVTSRRYVSLPSDVIARLEQEGAIEVERSPLFLPRNSIRTVIVLAFIGLAVFLYKENRLFNTPTMSLLCMIFAYLFGTLARKFGDWLNRRRTTPPSGTWGDIKAMTALIILLLAAIPEFVNQPFGMPPIFHQVALGLMLFYYGSR